MIPLARFVFWGPMALSIMGGLIVATLLTLFFLPALCAADPAVLNVWLERRCRILRPESPLGVPGSVADAPKNRQL